jgi:hypothetical protein
MEQARNQESHRGVIVVALDNLEMYVCNSYV